MSPSLRREGLRRRSRARGVGVSLAFALSVTIAGAGLGACSGSSDPPHWKLVWSDDFPGSTLDTSKWTVDTGDGFGTGQLDNDGAQNITVANNMLTITAQENGGAYTSGRIETQGHFSQTYGRFEASIKLPSGQGLWPAFWMLGENYSTAGWPACGEIDIMENRGGEPSVILGSMHGPGGDNLTAGYQLPAAGFHKYTVEWEPGVIRWYVDDNLYETQNADMLPQSQTWVFDAPFFILLDLAVGGQLGGEVASSTVFPQSMQVEYVHVYARPGE